LALMNKKDVNYLALIGLASILLGSMVAALSPGCSRSDRTDAETAPVSIGDRVQLPRDDGAHQSLLEWWYWAGHLKTDAGRWFGFELVFFEVHLVGVTLQVTHHAITDIQDKSFHYRIEMGRRIGRSPAKAIDLSHAGLWAKGADGRDRLHGRVDEYRMDLELVSQKAPVLQHDRGYIEFDFGGHTHYYSRGRMNARGTLRIGDQEVSVTGIAWFDHQWGDMGNVLEQSWDWFGIQLDDGREIMAFRMRVSGEEQLRGGSYSPAEGPPIRLKPEEVGITPQGEWKSPHTGCVYPRQWLVKVKDQEFLIKPVIEDQELHSYCR
jgi:predicted secreted hydrolase